MQKREEVYIVGSGVSGLIAAYELEREGFCPIIIDKTSEAGGRVKTISENGYELDLGFQVLLSAYPLANQYLDMEALNLSKLESGAMIYVNDKEYQIGDPLRNWELLLPTLLADVGSIFDKLRILKLNRYLKHKSLKEIFESPESTTNEYLKNFGFSPKIIHRFFKPFFAGIFLEPDLRTSSRMFEFVYKMFGEGYATIPESGIGEISKQLQSKLRHTKFRFNSEVEEVTNDFILMCSGEKITHQGMIIASNASALIRNMRNQDVAWKSCTCLYFEVDKTNIPSDTIALVADSGKYSNNLYAYQDVKTGKTILSVTTLQRNNNSDKEMIDKVTSEIKQYTGASQVNYIKHYKINEALPDIKNLRMTTQPSESRLLDNVFLAGDYLLNGSLNAAMESGRLAAQALVEKRKGIPL